MNEQNYIAIMVLGSIAGWRGSDAIQNIFGCEQTLTHVPSNIDSITKIVWQHSDPKPRIENARHRLT